MITKPSKNDIRKRIHRRVRKTITGTAERPRLSVFRSNKNIYAQLIDDEQGVTLVSASTKEKDLNLESSSNIDAAKEVGKLIAERAVEKGHNKIVFDRSGYIYHGRVKALADAAREAGLDF